MINLSDTYELISIVTYASITSIAAITSTVVPYYPVIYPDILLEQFRFHFLCHAERSEKRCIPCLLPGILHDCFHRAGALESLQRFRLSSEAVKVVKRQSGNTLGGTGILSYSSTSLIIRDTWLYGGIGTKTTDNVRISPEGDV